MFGTAHYPNSSIPRPSGVDTVILGGKRHDQVARALATVIMRRGAVGEVELLHADAMRYGHCLLDDEGRRVDPTEPERATLCVTYALGSE
jgi:hypothetical protein